MRRSDSFAVRRRIQFGDGGRDNRVYGASFGQGHDAAWYAGGRKTEKEPGQLYGNRAGDRIAQRVWIQ